MSAFGEDTAMRHARDWVWVMAVLVALRPSSADAKLGETLASLKQAGERAQDELESSRRPGTTEAKSRNALDRYYATVAELGRRAVSVAREHPDEPDAVEVLDWARKVGSEGDAELAGVIYDLMAERFLDTDAILPLCRTAWVDAVKSPRVEACLRAAVERSKSPKVRALCCFSLGRCYQELASAARDLNDPVRREFREASLDRFGPVVIGRLRSLDPERLRGEAEAWLDRTIREYGDQRPLGTFFPPLGEQAEGMLSQLRHLGIGRTAPDVEGEDLDGRPMKLSDSRGKVVLISFWATWCIPCREQVPHEKALVERMHGRPFVLIGVNGDNDRDQAKAYSARERVNWRSFWPGGSKQGIPLDWGISLWPTFYVIDAHGVIRENDSHDSATLDRMIESLVAEVEAGSKP